MAVTITKTQINAPITQANLTSGLDTALQNAGLSAPYAYSSGGNRRVYTRVYSAGKTYGTAIFETLVTTGLIISSRLGHSFDEATNTMSATPSLTSNNFTLSSSIGVNFIAINGGTEWAGVLVFQGTNIGALALIRPGSNKPTFWDEDTYPYFWQNKNVTGANYLLEYESTGGSALTPWTGSSNLLARFQPARLLGVNSNGQREVSPGLILESQAATNSGQCGNMSGDFARGATNLSAINDLIKPIAGVEEYLVVRLEASSGGLVLRTT